MEWLMKRLIERRPRFRIGRTLARIIHEVFEGAARHWGGCAVFRGVGDAVVGFEVGPEGSIWGDCPVVHGGGLAMRLARSAKPA
jgi:hypothetical protein